jgi:hypothetical protein
MKILTATNALLCMVLGIEAGCGGGATTSIPSNQQQSVAPMVSCTSVSGQQTQSPYFIGQNLQCSATVQGSTSSVTWTSSAGVIDAAGQLTGISSPATVSVTASYGSATARTTADFIKPSGAPAMIFNVATGVTGTMWEFVLDSNKQIYGTGWATNTAGSSNAQLFSMDFWTRKLNSVTLAQPSMLSAAVLAGTHPLFAGGDISNYSYTPLVVTSDSTPKLLTSNGCVQTGMLTALAYDSALGELWGAWSGDTQAARIKIDKSTFRPNCDSAQTLEASTPTEVRVPWVWSLHALPNGTISSGHYIANGITTGFITITDSAGNQIATREFPGLLDLRVTPPINENGATCYYVAGHDMSTGGDIWTVKKFDRNLQDVWTRTWTLSQLGKNEPYSIVPDPDGGVILAGIATQLSPAGGNTNFTDAVLFSVDQDGNRVWGPLRLNPSSSGTGACYISSLRITPDNQFLIAAAGCTQTDPSSFVLGFALP